MKEYKKFFTITIIVFIISMIIAPIALINWIDFMIGRHHYSKTADYINYLIEQKNAKAQEFDEKYGYKIVFFSGSNTLYGINSKYIHQKTKLPVVNYGIHMGLEHYIFDEVKKILKPGDIVIMPLEFSIYKENNPSIPSQLAEYLVTYGKDYSQKLTPIQKIGLAFYLIRLVIQYHKIEADPLSEEILSQTNDFGDFVANKGVVPDIQNNRKYISITEAIPKGTNKNFALYDFIQFCKKNDITLFAAAPFFYHKNTFTQDEKTAFENIKTFYEKNGVDFIGDIDTGCVYDEKKVYDFGYHANDAGQKERSDYFIKILGNLVFI